MAPVLSGDFFRAMTAGVPFRAMRSLGILIDQPGENYLMVHGQRGKFQSAAEPMIAVTQGL